MKKINLKNFFDIMNKKKFFLLQMFTNLIFQILVTFVIFYNININIINNNFTFILLILIQFGIIFIFSIFDLPIIFKFLLMTLFSIIWGLILINLKYYVPKEIIKTALFSTLGIFIGIFMFGVLLVAFGVYLDYRFSIVLLSLLLLLIITTIVLQLMNKYYTVHKSMAMITIILFTLFIIYETNDILYRDSKDVISASMDYYLDIMNIFTAMINYQM